MKSRHFVPALLGVLVWVAAPAVVHTEATEDKAFGELDSDKALLYAIRPKGARGGNAIGIDLFADNTFLMRVRGNSYGFVHLDPGTYTIWTMVSTTGVKRIEFVPGETMYLLFGDLGMALVNEEEGQAYLDEVRFYNPPDPEVEANRGKKEAKAEARFEKAEKWASKYEQRIEVETPTTPETPSDTTGLARVPRYSPVEIELMETVSSYMSTLGEEIWFRVRQDALAHGEVWLPEGTPVKGVVCEIHSARRGGGSGGLEIMIPSVDALDGTHVPLIGHIVDAGRHRHGAAAYGGLIGTALVKGREAFELRGDLWKVWTRTDVWLKPTLSSATGKTANDAKAAHSCNVKAPDSLSFNLEKRQEPESIALVIETHEPVSSLELSSVGDWPLPSPSSAIQIERRDGFSTATFDGWSLLRHLRPGAEPKVVSFTGTTESGQQLFAEGSLRWGNSAMAEP